MNIADSLVVPCHDNAWFVEIEILKITPYLCDRDLTQEAIAIAIQLFVFGNYKDSFNATAGKRRKYEKLEKKYCFFNNRNTSIRSLGGTPRIAVRDYPCW
ncbi:MAG: hypothetical protein AAGB13_12775 [Cyanobacteria bacterium P01_F01_bin.33]